MVSGRNFCTGMNEKNESGFNNGCRAIEIIGDCMRECIADTRGSVCKTAVRMQCMHGRRNVE